MTDTKRQKRTSPSNPKLEAVGWDKLDSTQLIQRAQEKLKETARDVRDTATSLMTPPAPKGT